MKLIFKLVSMFWILAPVIFAVGRVLGKFNYIGHNWQVFLGLMAIAGLVAFWNCPDEKEDT